jgi:hypothetical protein
MRSIQRILLVGGATVALSVAAITVSASPPRTNAPLTSHAGKVADDLVRPGTYVFTGKVADDLVRPDTFSLAGKQLDDQVTSN